MNIEEIIEEIDGLTVGQMRELTLKLQERYDVKPATAPVSQIIEDPVEEVEEQFEFDVVMTAIDAAQKIKTIKAVRESTHLGLQESKAAVEDLPSTVVTAVTREVADRIRAALVATGATVELR